MNLIDKYVFKSIDHLNSRDSVTKFPIKASKFGIYVHLNIPDISEHRYYIQNTSTPSMFSTIGIGF